MPVFPVSDELAKLPPLKWRDIYVPVASLVTDGGHDVAEHKKPDRPGARLENTGELPRKVQARCLFRTGIQLDQSYRNSVPLFPQVADMFVAALRDGTTGTLAHPRFGAMQCKVLTWREAIESSVRDGAVYDVSWEETNSDDSALGLTSSALASASVEAISLDTNLALLKAKGGAKYAAIVGANAPTSFADLVRNIQASADMTSFLARRGAGSVDVVVAQVVSVQQSLASLADVSTNAARQSCERLVAALNLLKGQTQAIRRIGTFIVPDGRALTLAAVAVLTSSRIKDLLQLNAQLGTVTGSVTLRPGTTVRYYLAA